MGKREFFPAFFSYTRTLKRLSDEEIGRVFRAALLYAESGVEPELSDKEMFGFDFIREDIDRANAKYETLCETMRSNVNKRIEKQQALSIDNKSKHSEGKGEGKSKSEGKGKGKVDIVVAPEAAPTAPQTKLPPSVDEVAEYIQSMNYDVDADKFCSYYAAQGWKLSNGLPMKDWKACCKTWHYRNKESPPRAAPSAKSNNDEIMDYLDRVINGSE